MDRQRKEALSEGRASPVGLLRPLTAARREGGNTAPTPMQRQTSPSVVPDDEPVKNPLGSKRIAASLS